MMLFASLTFLWVCVVPVAIALLPSKFVGFTKSSVSLTPYLSTTALNQISRNVMIDVDGGQLCYDILKSAERVGHPIVYLPGLIRPKSEAKSLNLQAFCKKAGFTFLCADYFGNGRSSGKPTDGTVGRFVRDTIFLIDNVIGTNQGKVVLVGHGVGAWVAFLIAMKRPDLVSGIVGMAADPDFTEELLWKKLPEEIKEKIMKEGAHEITWGNEKYPISKNLIEDGRNNLLLSGPPGMRFCFCLSSCFVFSFILNYTSPP